MGEFPVANSAFYRQLIVTDVAGGSQQGEPLNEALDPFSPPPEAEDHPATGVLLTFEQGWFQKGLALGELRMSLCLAPGEVTRLAIVDWRRQTQLKDQKTLDERDAVRSAAAADSSAVSVQDAVARQAASGLAVTSSDASHSEGGASAGFLLWGASGSTSSSSMRGLTATSSTGSQLVSAVGVKNIQQTTEQVAQSTRSARATQIQEVTESEQQSTSTRVVANYNHAHALTIQYYECLQIYDLQTKVIKADRCIFIPLTPYNFDKNSMAGLSDATVELLREVLRDLGATRLDEMVGNFHGAAPLLKDAVDALRAKVEALQAEIARNESTMAVNRQSLRDKVRELAETETRLKLLRAGGTATPEVIQSFEETRKEILFRRDVVQAELTALEEVTPQSRKELGAGREELAEKEKALEEYSRMHGVLQKNRDVLNQQMWMRIEAPVWRRLLAGRSFPYGEYSGQEIGGLIDPTPIGYFGNMVAFRWDFPRSKADQAADFERSFTRRTTVSGRIVLPSEGVFAEAVLGRANSAEKIDITRFWNWQDSPIPILPPQMSEVDTGSRARDVAAAPPLEFSEALAQLKEQKLLAEGVDDGAVLSALESSITSDAGALISGAVQSGLAVSSNAATGAGRAGDRSVQASKNVQDFVVGLANSEVAKIGAKAVAARTGGISAVGGLLSAASKGAGSAAAQTAETNPPSESDPEPTP